MKQIVIVAMPEGGPTKDGNHVCLTFEDSEGQSHTLKFKTNDLRKYVAIMAGVLEQMRKKPVLGSTEHVISAFDPTQLTIGPAMGEDKVLVTFATTDQIDYAFAIPAQDIQPITQRLLEAARICRDRLPPQRH